MKHIFQVINTAEASQQCFGRFILKFKLKTNWRLVKIPTVLCVKAIRYIASESKNSEPQCFEVGFSAKTDYNLCITFLFRIET